jgi:asparagine synthase (glutamine-hydrolysing)
MTACRLAIHDRGTLFVHGQILATTDELCLGLSDYLHSGFASELLRWPGSYSAMAVRGESDLTIVADLAGQFPVYFSTGESGFLFGSDATVLARRSNAIVDRSALSAHLLGWADPTISGERTILSGVRQVQAEAAVRVDHRHRIRHLDVGIPAGEMPTLDACADVLREQLRTAVRLRTAARPETTVSADLSGGVDSTSLAFLAAAHRSAPLPVFTYGSTVAPVRSDLVRATAVASQTPEFDHHIVEGTAAHSPFQDLHESPSADLPNTADTVFARSRRRFAAAAESGSKLHLTGDGGDLLAGPVPAYLADFAARREYAALWRHSVSWARLRNRPAALVVRRALHVGVQSPRQALLEMAFRLARPQPQTASPPWEEVIAYWDGPGAAAAWLTPWARRSVVEHLRARAECATFSPDWRPSDYAIRADLAAAGPVQRGLRAAAELCGVELHAPYLDSTVIRTCLGLTAVLRTSPAENKPLFRRALSGLVPDSALSRRTKGNYTSDQYTGLRRSEAFLRSLLRAPVTAELGVLEPRPLLATLDRGLLGLDIAWPAFTRAVATEIWLRRFHGQDLPATGRVT